ncbi:phospholipase A1-II 1-like [Euphorbia lathyris]|uniref:phospholipase A1-II 1-like n=1 Tax=Euphorbia lathyris TaxID=212925 RepID=UPI00331419EC
MHCEEERVMEDIAANWRALSGIEDNWEKQISDGIDNNLRRYLIHYGQRVGAVGDSFNEMKKTKGYGLSLFPPEELFTQTCLEKGNPFKYKVSHLIYARSEFNVGTWWSQGDSGYMGYVAVATDEGKCVLGRRDILICWRGTLLDKESAEDCDIFQIRADEVFHNSPAKVHQGFLGVYTNKTSFSATDSNKDYTHNSAREQVLAAVRKHVDHYGKLNESVSITVAGHSLGAAIATLNSMDIVSNGYNKPTGSSSDKIFPVTAFVYASPRLGNKDFVKLFNSLQPNLHLLNIRNAKDIIPDFPPTWLDYHEVGTKLDIDIIHSEHLNESINVLSHRLHVYLYGIASYKGKDKNSELAIDFDIACLNKYDDLLKECLMVPKRWWSSVVKHGMVQMDNGFWEVHYDYVPPLPPHVPDIPNYK